jgi:hypothetical protein
MTKKEANFFNASLSQVFINTLVATGMAHYRALMSFATKLRLLPGWCPRFAFSASYNVLSG